MAKRLFPEDLREFLKLLNARRVEYLLIGGYAVVYYGHHRTTAVMDIWVGMSATNAAKIVRAIREFGFDVEELKPELFLTEYQIIRMSEPPLRIEILTTIDGVDFAECYVQRNKIKLDGLQISLIHLEDLKKNKQASGRPKDLLDLEVLQS